MAPVSALAIFNLQHRLTMVVAARKLHGLGFEKQTCNTASTKRFWLLVIKKNRKFKSTLLNWFSTDILEQSVSISVPFSVLQDNNFLANLRNLLSTSVDQEEKIPIDFHVILMSMQFRAVKHT